MGLFWKSNGKKPRKDLKNLFTDKRYKSGNNELKGDDLFSNSIAKFINTFLKEKK